MKSLIIKKEYKELEVYEVDKNDLISLDLSRLHIDYTDHLRIKLTKQDVLELIEFLKLQVEN